MKIYERKFKGGITYYLHYCIEGKLIRERLPREFDRETAELYMAKRKLEMARGETGVPKRKNLSLRAALHSLVESKRVDCVDLHYKNLKRQKKEMEDFFGGDTPVRLLKDSDVNRFKIHLRAKNKNRPETVNKKITTLKAALAKAVRDGKIGKNPLANVQRVSDPGRDVWRWLRDKEIESLLSTLKEGRETKVERRNGRNYMRRLGKNLRLRRLVIFLLNTGARRGEALAVEWRDVDFGRKIVTLYTTKHAAKCRKAKPRYIPMNEALEELCSGIQKESEKSNGKVFEGSGNWNREFNRAWELSGKGHCRIHDLRHTFASHLVMGGTPLPVVMELLGHSTIAMTMRYAHLAPQAAKTAVAGLNFGGAKSGAKVVSMDAMEA